MDEFISRLAVHAVIALDTSVFIYHFELHARYMALARAALDHIQSGRSRGVTSVITLMELTVHPWRQQRPAVAREYETLLINFPHLLIADVDREIARRAAQLRAIYSIRPADALHIGTALSHNATAFLTNDTQLQRTQGLPLDIIVLENFVPTSKK